MNKMFELSNLKKSMNTYLRIARLELNVLFFSPIAWIILIIFAVQIGVTLVIF